MITLTQKKFSRETFKLLNNYLNFVPNQNEINKKEFHNQLGKFYRRILGWCTFLMILVFYLFIKLETDLIITTFNVSYTFVILL